MQITRRSFVGTLGVAAGAAAFPQPSDMKSPSVYGSGHFGKWTEDEFGLPAFHYTCEQITDPKAVTSVSPGILAPNEHIHQVGNDRIVALASNFGHVQVRQDEGAPKFLNAHLPDRRQYGGGFGYLISSAHTLSTYYSGEPESFDRIFGIGYYRKRVRRPHAEIDQVICAPFGDDPVLLSSVTVINRGDAAEDFRWIEYWGCQVFQFSFRAFIGMASGLGRPEKLRQAFGDRFAHQCKRLDGDVGLLETKRFLGYDEKDAAAFERIKAGLAARPNPFLSKIADSVPEASFEDEAPPASFLCSLDGPAAGVSANAGKFFGAGGVAKPDGISAPLDGDLASVSGLLLERHFRLRPGESGTLHFLYGYLPAGTELDPLVRKYRESAPLVWKRTSEDWSRHGMRFAVDSEPWVKRESAWNHYYLRSAMTYDSYFHEHILSQGAIYQYFMGFQGASRDPLQHALPFVFSDPSLVKEILRYTLKEVRPDGSIPYGIVGHGMIMPAASDNSSDIPLWLLWTASEYVLATRDFAFLDDVIPTWPLYGKDAGKETAANLLARCYRHQIENVRTGEHGLMRMLNDDWNDALVMFWGQKAHAECVEKGESVLNSAMAAWVFDYYARMLDAAGKDVDFAARVRASADEHRAAARKQWNGKWVRRAWLGPTSGWLGENGLWLEPQPWAILAGVVTPEQARRLVDVMEEELRRGSPIGAMQMNRSQDSLAAAMVETGTSVNGGIWPSLNATLIWALAAIDPEKAWDEWKKNSFAVHAEVYPEIWYNTWSGGDTLNSTLSKSPGQTVNAGFLRYTDFPVMNLHSHACPLYSATKLLGIEFNRTGLAIAPALPAGEYQLESPLVGVRKTKTGYEGWYAPLAEGNWTVAILLLQDESQRIAKAEVNGRRRKFTRAANGSIELRGPSSPGKPLRWTLRWQ